MAHSLARSLSFLETYKKSPLGRMSGKSAEVAHPRLLVRLFSRLHQVPHLPGKVGEKLPDSSGQDLCAAPTVRGLFHLPCKVRRERDPRTARVHGLPHPSETSPAKGQNGGHLEALPSLSPHFPIIHLVLSARRGEAWQFRAGQQRVSAVHLRTLHAMVCAGVEHAGSPAV